MVREASNWDLTKQDRAVRQGHVQLVQSFQKEQGQSPMVHRQVWSWRGLATMGIIYPSKGVPIQDSRQATSPSLCVKIHQSKNFQCWPNWSVLTAIVSLLLITTKILDQIKKQIFGGSEKYRIAGRLGREVQI